MTISNYLIGTLVFLMLPNISYAKPLSKFKKFLYPIHFSFNIGYGLDRYTFFIDQIVPFEKDGAFYLYSSQEKGGSVYLFRSFGEPFVRTKLYESQSFWKDLSNVRGGFYQGAGGTIPITFSTYVDILKKFRIELGSSLSIVFIKTLKPLEKFKDRIPSFTDGVGRHYRLKFFLMPGFKLFENYAYSLLVNAQVGLGFLYGDFIKDKHAIMAAMFPIPVGAGLKLEKHISEYLSLYGNIAYENIMHKSSVNPLKNKGNLVLFIQSFCLQFGVSLHPAEMSKCPLPNCEITIKHKHADTAYRGSSWVKGRDSVGKRLYNK